MTRLPRLTPASVLLSFALMLLLRVLGGETPVDMAIAPIVIAAGLSALPGLLSHLFGGGGGSAARRAKLLAKIARLTSPGNIGNVTGQFYQQALASPAYSQGQSAIAAGANATAGQIASSLAQRGIGTTGTGAILNSLTPSIVGSQQAGLQTAAYQGAQGQAQNSIQALINALIGTPQGPGETSQLFGAGLSAFGPLLEAWIKSKYPASAPTPVR